MLLCNISRNGCAHRLQGWLLSRCNGQRSLGWQTPEREHIDAAIYDKIKCRNIPPPNVKDEWDVRATKQAAHRNPNIQDIYETLDVLAGFG